MLPHFQRIRIKLMLAKQNWLCFLLQNDLTYELKYFIDGIIVRTTLCTNKLVCLYILYRLYYECEVSFIRLNAFLNQSWWKKLKKQFILRIKIPYHQTTKTTSIFNQVFTKAGFRYRSQKLLTTFDQIFLYSFQQYTRQ